MRRIQNNSHCILCLEQGNAPEMSGAPTAAVPQPSIAQSLSSSPSFHQQNANKENPPPQKKKDGKKGRMASMTHSPPPKSCGKRIPACGQPQRGAGRGRERSAGGRRCGGSASPTPPFRAPSPLSAAARLHSIPTPQPLPPHPRFPGPAHPRLGAVRRRAARLGAGRARRSRSAPGAAVPGAAVRSRYGPAALSPLRRSAPPPARPGPAHRGGNGAAGGC